MPCWWERSEKRKMSRLVGADKKAVLTQLSSRYNRGEEKSSSKSVFSDACAVKKSCWRPDLPVWLISILVPLVTLSRSLIKLASKSENTETIIKTHGHAKTSFPRRQCAFPCTTLFSTRSRYGPYDMMNNPDSRSHLKAGNGPVQKFAPPMVFGLPASHMKISIAWFYNLVNKNNPLGIKRCHDLSGPVLKCCKNMQEAKRSSKSINGSYNGKELARYSKICKVQ